MIINIALGVLLAGLIVLAAWEVLAFFLNWFLQGETSGLGVFCGLMGAAVLIAVWVAA